MKTKLILLICMAGLLALFAGFWMGKHFVELKEETNEALIEAHIAQIEFKLRQYYAKHGSFPPAKYQAAPEGPEHSWRVMIVNRGSLLDDYNYSEAWNSSNNLAALSSVPKYFCDEHGADVANYITIGKDEEWPCRGRPLKSRVITIGEDEFLIVHYPESEIHWGEPKY